MSWLLPFSILWVFASMGTLFYFKHKVLQVEQEIALLSKECAQYEEQIALLKTEWSYLTHPKRIAELAHKYYPNIGALHKNQLIEWVPENVDKEQSITPRRS